MILSVRNNNNKNTIKQNITSTRKQKFRNCQLDKNIKELKEKYFHMLHF